MTSGRKGGPKNGPKKRSPNHDRYIYCHHEWGPFSGLVFGTAFRSCHHLLTDGILIPMQAFATWRWHNFLEAEGIGDKTVVRINMDESCCKLSPQVKRGFVALPAGLKSRQFLQIERRNPLKLRRSAVTLAAFVSDNDEVNQALPQIIVEAEHVIQAWMTPLLMNDRTDSIFVIRRKSAWLRSDVVVNIINVLGEALKPFGKTCRFVLMLDAAKIHLSKKVVQACTRHGIYLMYVPASMTSLLQPLDTHVFSLYKRYIRREYEEALVNSDSGEISTFAFLKILIAAIENIIQARSWKNAFLQTGFGNQQQGISRSVKMKLELEAVPLIQASLPSLEELHAIYPSNVEPVVDCLFDLFLPPKQRRRILPESFTCAAPLMNPANPWQGRLRSSSRLISESQPEPEHREVPTLSLPAASSSDHPWPAIPSAPTTSSSAPRVLIPKAKRLFPLRRRPHLPPPGQ